eukprot:SAG11_NODE_4531_length_1862_cov_2.161656_2_plen_52_part_00
MNACGRVLSISVTGPGSETGAALDRYRVYLCTKWVIILVSKSTDVNPTVDQ